jgi:excinuclease ABC subunit C
MIVFQDGKPRKSDYRRFKIDGLSNQDDYASMHQVVRRRFSHFLKGDKGFTEKTDLLLIDGGINHAAIISDLLRSMDIEIPIFGMVKDDRHRTRALVTPEGKEISIDNNQAVFSLIGNIQEETHRFAINYHRKLRSNRLKYSELDKVPGVGPKRKQELLKKFKSITAIRNATFNDLMQVLPRDVALAVFQNFHKE